MRHISFWLGWAGCGWLGAVLGVLCGYMVGAALMLLAGMAMGLALVVLGPLFMALGGMVAGFVIACVQGALTRRAGVSPRGWLLGSVAGWGVAGMMLGGRSIELLTGGLEALTLVALIGVAVTTMLQVLGGASLPLPRVGVHGIAAVSTLTGAVCGVALLGRLTAQNPFTPALGLLRERELVYGRTVEHLQVVGNQLLFFVYVDKGIGQDENRWELWRSDGTADGTERIGVGYTGRDAARVPTTLIAGNRLLFDTYGSWPTQDWRGYVPSSWQSDGTSAGTGPMRFSATLPEPYIQWAATDTQLFVAIAQGGEGCALVTQPGGLETQTLMRRFPDSCPSPLASIGTRVIFVQEPIRPPMRCEIWSSDGSAAGTLLLATYPATPTKACVTSPQVIGVDLFWTHQSTDGRTDIWRSDGTAAATRQIATVDTVIPGTATVPSVPLSNAYLAAVSPEGASHCTLWAVNPATNTVSPVLGRCPYPSVQTDAGLVGVERGDDDLMALTLRRENQGAPIVLARDIRGGKPFPIITILAQQGETVYLQVRDGDTCTVWGSDGTTAGTLATALPCIEAMASYQGRMVFLTRTEATAVALWQLTGPATPPLLIRVIP